MSCRFDVPREWPELLPVLSQAVQSSEDTVQHRGLLFLHHTIKALASKRLTADRRAFTELTGQVIEHGIVIVNKAFIYLGWGPK